MPQSRFAEALNGQIGYEFGASQQYIAVSVYYDAETLPRLAAHFYRQADEEVVIPGIEAPRTGFGDVVEPVALALAQEKRVTEQIGALATLARENGDYAGEQFMQWFIKEQVEEVSSMNSLLTVVERARENPLLAEEYLARESAAEAADPTAPHAAGGAL
jgi:ferritin